MNNITMQIPEFEWSFKFSWQENKKIKVYIEDGRQILILSNKEWLISLANHLLNLAQDSVPNHYHIQLDEYNSLEDWSFELIIEKDNI
jgi:hypothetical protein